MPGWRRCLDVLAPQRCIYCDQTDWDDAAVCSRCASFLIRNDGACPRCALPACRGSLCPGCQSRPGPLSRVTAPFVYDGATAYLISRWKFDGRRQLCTTVARLMLDAASLHAGDDLLLATPLHWRRQIARGFNQSEDLLHALQRLHPPLRESRRSSTRLCRHRATAAQTRSSRSARQANLGDAFKVVGSVVDRRVILLDDVCTTGATGNAMARALLDAGAERVSLWCFARTPAH